MKYALMSVAMLMLAAGLVREDAPKPKIKPNITYTVKINDDGSSDLNLQMHSDAKNPSEAARQAIDAIQEQQTKPTTLEKTP